MCFIPCSLVPPLQAHELTGLAAFRSPNTTGTVEMCGATLGSASGTLVPPMIEQWLLSNESHFRLSKVHNNHGPEVNYELQVGGLELVGAATAVDENGVARGLIGRRAEQPG